MKQISRRTLLRGVGATIALPWLEAMTPIASMLPRNWGPAKNNSPRRLAFMYIPNGVIGNKWFPKKTDDESLILTKSLSPLKDVVDDVTVISGLNRTRVSGEAHAQAASCWLTSALPSQREDGGHRYQHDA